MSQAVAGSFASTSVAALGQTSAGLVVPSTPPQMKVTATGLDASNTVKTQKRTAPGGAYADVTTYNSDQAGTLVTVAHGEEWQLVLVTQQPFKTIAYKLSVEN